MFLFDCFFSTKSFSQDFPCQIVSESLCTLKRHFLNYKFPLSGACTKENFMRIRVNHKYILTITFPLEQAKKDYGKGKSLKLDLRRSIRSFAQQMLHLSQDILIFWHSVEVFQGIGFCPLPFFYQLRLG